MVFIEISHSNSKRLWIAHPLSKLNIHHPSDLFSMNPKPFKDELFTSWICRLAKANYFSYVKFLRNFSEIDFEIMKNSRKKQYWMFDLDKEIPIELLHALSKKTGISRNKIMNLTLKEWEIKIYYLFITRKGSSSSRKLGALRYCPICLKEDEIPYFRKCWKLRYLTCCDKHKVYLYDRCSNPECRRPINLSLVKYEKSITECVYCGTDLSNSRTIGIPENSSYIEIMIDLMLILENGKWLNSSDKQFSSIHFFEALYFLCRFVIKYFPFNSSEFKNDGVISSRILNEKKDYLSQRSYVFEDMQISQLVIEIAYSFLIGDSFKLKTFLSKFQTEFNWETCKGCPEILKKFRVSRGDNPVITKKRILDAINYLKKQNKSITYDKIAKEARCAHNFYLSHPHLKKLVDNEKAKYYNYYAQRRDRKKYDKIFINPDEVINAIIKLKKINKKITYKAIASLIGENYWNLKKPGIIELIKPHLAERPRKKKYFYDNEDILSTIELIRKKKLEVSINEVCRQLKCHKSFFRNHPALKNVILKAKAEDEKKFIKTLPGSGNFELLSDKAKKYEPKYQKYVKEMEEQGKNWRITRNEILSKKLEIPIDVLVLIKLKYCPSTRKV
ncbi:MAG: TniQ family protein, partial [Candidatus Odinarchaeota archaeon]